MKKNNAFYILTLVIFAAFTPFYTAAGTPDTDNLSYGIRAGLAISTLTFEHPNPYVKYDYLAGFCGGVFTGYEIFRGLLGLEAEISYIRKGNTSIFQHTSYTLSNGTVINAFSTTYVFDDVEAPVFCRVFFLTNNNGMKPSFIIGPVVTGVLQERSVIKNITDKNQVYSTYTSDITNNATRIDLGFITGLGLEFPMWQGKLSLDLKYNMGPLDRVDSQLPLYDSYGNIINPGSYIKAHNSAFSITAGYGF